MAESVSISSRPRQGRSGKVLAGELRIVLSAACLSPIRKRVTVGALGGDGFHPNRKL